MPHALAHPSHDENNAGFKLARSPKKRLTQTRDEPYQDTGRLFV
jgi:hypothetical protein